jgi:hypothetical protein
MFLRDLRILRMLAGFAVAAALGLTVGLRAQQPPAAPASAPPAPSSQAPAPAAPATPPAPAAQTGPLLGFTADAGLVLFTLKDDCPPAAAAAAAPAPGQPAAAPAAPAPAAPATAPAAPAAGQAPAQKCQPVSKDFEAFFAKVKEALERGSKPEYKQMAAGWKLYKVTDGAAPGDVLYASVIDPAVKGADYDPVKILGDVMPDDARALYPKLQAAIKSVNRLNLQTTLKMGGM